MKYDELSAHDRMRYVLKFEETQLSAAEVDGCRASDNHALLSEICVVE